MDRCDTPDFWFLFTSDGRPFMFAENSPAGWRILSSERRRNLGSSVELRRGNWAAATIDEIMSSWPADKRTLCKDGTFFHVEPYDLLEEAVEDRT